MHRQGSNIGFQMPTAISLTPLYQRHMAVGRAVLLCSRARWRRQSAGEQAECVQPHGQRAGDVGNQPCPVLGAVLALHQPCRVDLRQDAVLPPHRRSWQAPHAASLPEAYSFRYTAVRFAMN